MTFLPSKKIKTKNIANSISKFGAEHVLKQGDYTFTINNVQTQIKTISDEDYFTYKDDIHDYYEHPNKIVDEHVRFKQLYTITISTKNESIIKLNYDINFSENTIEPSIIIYPDSTIPYKEYKPKEIYQN